VARYEECIRNWISLISYKTTEDYTQTSEDAIDVLSAIELLYTDRRKDKVTETLTSGCLSTVLQKLSGTYIGRAAGHTLAVTLYLVFGRICLVDLILGNVLNLLALLPLTCMGGCFGECFTGEAPPERALYAFLRGNFEADRPWPFYFATTKAFRYAAVGVNNCLHCRLPEGLFSSTHHEDDSDAAYVRKGPMFRQV